MSQYHHELEVARQIARESGDIMLHYFDKDQGVESKQDESPVTVADQQINELVIDKLSQEFPSDGVIGEEKSTAEYGRGRLWFCDPLDGTTGYIWGTPTSMFSLGLVVDGEPKVGVVYDPFLKRIYTSVVGQDSFMDGERLGVSNDSLQNGVVAITSTVTSIFNQATHIKMLIENNVKLACFSGAVYKACLVARGKFVGYIEHGVYAHDIAAVQLIIEEAGGKLTDLEGKRIDYTKPIRGAIASNGLVHDQLVSFVGTS